MSDALLDDSIFRDRLSRRVTGFWDYRLRSRGDCEDSLLLIPDPLHHFSRQRTCAARMKGEKKNVTLKNTRGGYYRCTRCGKAYASILDLRQHEKICARAPKNGGQREGPAFAPYSMLIATHDGSVPRSSLPEFQSVRKKEVNA